MQQLPRTFHKASTLHCWLGHLTRKKPVPDMTYNAFGATLSLTQSINLQLTDRSWPVQRRRLKATETFSVEHFATSAQSLHPPH